MPGKAVHIPVQFALSTPMGRLEVRGTAPTGAVRPLALLPLLNRLSDAAVSAAERHSQQGGADVSCRKGCGACCRQLVPITATESHHIAAVLDALPEPQRSVVKGRFATARERLAQAGLLERLLDDQARGKEFPRQIGLEYFALGVACPFLEQESCSIHSVRPLACREYLVSSPASHCRDPSPETVRVLPMPLKVSHALAAAETQERARNQATRPSPQGRQPGPGATPTGAPTVPDKPVWVPLVLAPEWSASHPDKGPRRPAEAIFREVLGHLVSERSSGNSAASDGGTAT